MLIELINMLAEATSSRNFCTMLVSLSSLRSVPVSRFRRLGFLAVRCFCTM